MREGEACSPGGGGISGRWGGGQGRDWGGRGNLGSGTRAEKGRERDTESKSKKARIREQRRRGIAAVKEIFYLKRLKPEWREGGETGGTGPRRPPGRLANANAAESAPTRAVAATRRRSWRRRLAKALAHTLLLGGRSVLPRSRQPSPNTPSPQQGSGGERWLWRPPWPPPLPLPYLLVGKIFQRKKYRLLGQDHLVLAGPAPLEPSGLARTIAPWPIECQ